MENTFSTNNNNPDSNNIENNDYDAENINILCVLWKNGKLGAAYYDLSGKLLYIYEEMVDLGPQFMKTRCLYREVDPKFVLSFGHITDDFIKTIIDLIMNPTLDDEDTTITSDLRALPPNLFLLSNIREYSYENCKAVLTALTLASNLDITENDKELYLQSLINFDYRMSIHAIGCLVKYIEKNWAFFLQNREDLQFLHIHEKNLRGHVLIDQTSLNAFHIFRQYYHDSNFKRGMNSSNREGISIFKLFSTTCQSKLGQDAIKFVIFGWQRAHSPLLLYLHDIQFTIGVHQVKSLLEPSGTPDILMNPINDIDELSKRLDFINFALTPTNREFIESLQDNIKVLSKINMILTKIQNSRATARDWNILYKTIYHTVFMSELSISYKDQSLLLTEFHNSITINLIGLENSINDAIDFTNSTTGRPTIKMGLDENLDAKKLRRQDMSKHLTAAARVAVEQLPNYLNECEVVYLPEMGHLIAVKEWESNCDPHELQSSGFEFMFTLNGSIHYKNPLCIELDQYLGDVNAEIIAHENRILQRLGGFVLKYNADIRKPLEIIAKIDALIAMSKVAIDNNYIKPILNLANIHEIEECRHPLMELVTLNFESNHLYSGGNQYSHIKVITGPNGSGKSIYLKQIGLIIYLAHTGSYVPAKYANISMVHSIHTRIQAIESASVRLSSFMIDMIQVTQALHNSKYNSLILLDEFGRGTTGQEGFAILVGTLEKYMEQQEYCPHILITTHYQNISKYLPENQIIEYLTMTHRQYENSFLFLYKLKKGTSTSYAFDIAREFGLDNNIIQRSIQLFDNLQNNELIQPLDSITKYPNLMNNRGHDRDEDEIEEFLLNIEIPEADVDENLNDNDDN